MGSRGPKKTPAATKKRRGTYRADRDAEPIEFAGKIPPVDKTLRKEVVAEWNRLAPLCAKVGLLTEADWLAWRLGMAAYDTWLCASETVLKEGAVLWTEKGYPVQHPMVSIGGKAWQSVLKFCREFGLTPSARSGLKIQDAPEAQDEFQSHLEKGTPGKSKH
jgi:P27 family predicted phage terminase small subunit